MKLAGSNRRMRHKDRGPPEAHAARLRSAREAGCGCVTGVRMWGEYILLVDVRGRVELARALVTWRTHHDSGWVHCAMLVDVLVVAVAPLCAALSNNGASPTLRLRAATNRSRARARDLFV
ncbi:hypothetical protein EON66_01695, partial [archaeon]